MKWFEESITYLKQLKHSFVSFFMKKSIVILILNPRANFEGLFKIRKIKKNELTVNFGVDEVLEVAEICGSECPRQERMKLRLDEEGQFVPLSIDDSLHMPENA